MRKNFYSLGILVAILSFAFQVGFGQGSTSSRINGQVVGGAESLIGATVLATHEPTGFQYGTNTNVEGYFTLNNVQVGGPYTITISFVGYNEKTITDVFLNLGQTETFNVELAETSVALDEVVITAGGLFDGNRTGSETKVSEEVIATIPTSDRGLRDYLRITPQADVANDGATNGGSISFSGVNNRFNSIFIDGAVNNDVFGLANSGTNGGQAGISPISPDAIEQIQVVIAPYDVTLGGFAGGGINAVTRSGTNEVKGSAYFFNRNQNLSGKTPTDDPNATRTRLADFTARTYGARIGGPLIKNKLFYFANVEIQRDEIPRPFIQSEYIGDSDANTLQAIRNKLMSDYGYDPGEFANNNQTTDGEKVLVKLDYQINEKNKLTARHSYVKGTTEIHPRPSASRVVFGNVGYIFPSTTNSTALELKSILGDNVSNNLIVGRTTVRDDRDILGDPFPQIIMPDGAGTVVVGTDNFSLSNIVNQDVFTITNNFNLFKGKHNWTFGTHNEFFTIENLFTIFSTPRYEYFFNGVNRFLAGENPDLLLFGHEQAFGGDNIRLGDNATNLGPSFNAMQLAFYAQDEIQVNKDFKFTVGLRLDIPIFSEDPPLDNTAFNNTTVPLLEGAGWDLQGARASQAPATQLMFSPRIGFNFDVNGDNSTQLRGGIGVFTSRVPWVWPGGMFIRNGLNSAFNVRVGVGQQEIIADENQWLTDLTSSQSPTGDVDLFTENFKYPQVFRGSLALDKKLGNGWDATAEFTYTKTLNNMDVKQVNISPRSEGPLSASDSRPTIDFGSKLDPTYSNITLVSNTNEGYTANITGQLSKQFSKNTSLSLAYSYTDAHALIDGRGFINNTNWLNVLSVQGNNNPATARSTFAVGSRITGFFSHKFDYSDVTSTTLSLFYTGRSGSPFSYTYNSEISDISSSAGYNDLIYVPASANEINLIDIEGGATAAQQWSALDAFIKADDYLSSRRGDYAENNESRTPFENVLDLKLTQDINIGGQNFQITFDVNNFTNLLNKDWGRRYFVSGNTFPLIQAQRNTDTNEPEFEFRDPGDPWAIVQAGSYSSRWNGQVGVRWNFGANAVPGRMNKSMDNGSKAMTKSSGKMDSDGDGVKDSKDLCPEVAGEKKFKGCPMEYTEYMAMLKAEEEARMKAEEEARIKAAEAARLKAEMESKAAAEAAAKAKAEEEARMKAEAEAAEEAKMAAAKAEAARVEAIRVRNREISTRFAVALKDLQFNTARSTFKQSSYDKMDEAVAILNQYSDIKILIQGHTDSQGDEDKNLALSQSRADAVKEYLVSKGIADGRILTNGLGESNPIADNKTAEGRAMNRRVEFIVIR